ncbi:hypothetical protein CcrSwift_gp288 [Caulobacter phage CcrSwift]|uniref:Uncharacterized protein n=1 Tax=Caulobacter phage CcrSwift TaxID=2927984 RepID=K4JTY4_9CAUD|nr:hypothetical protein D870_gp133 [Caulobacter phage CcrSwift]AFU88606.1 hypothetical protein CcrSwift_gp288 [Caulobacter phage CcrSwift]
MSYQQALMDAQAAFHAHEMDVNDRAWERWLKKLEDVLGFDVDADNSEEAKAFHCDMGYSLDETFEMFDKGMSVEQARVAILRACYEAAARAAGVGLDALVEAEARAVATRDALPEKRKVDREQYARYAELLGKMIARIREVGDDSGAALEKAFGQ